MAGNYNFEVYDCDIITLDPESYRCKEIYAYFGLTMFHVQCLERTLSMLSATVYNSNANRITRSQFDSLLEANFEKTLGQLINNIKRSVDLPDGFENKLADALKKRNFLAHHYFWERSLKFGHKQGQEEMIGELSKACVYFEELDQELEIILRKWMDSRGINEESINKIMDKLRSAEVKDGESIKHILDKLLDKEG
jgi:hypothetical protein